jgi:hypothetical protein
VDSVVQSLLGITVIVFMAGNLLEVGLKLNLASVAKTVGDVRFLFLTVLIAFILALVSPICLRGSFRSPRLTPSV